MADGNVRVHPSFSGGQSVLLDRRVGLSRTSSRPAELDAGLAAESLHLNGALRAGTAAMAGLLGIPVVGKSILVSREALNAIGGIASATTSPRTTSSVGWSPKGYRVVLSGDEIETRRFTDSAT
jgi:hypothetical protein